MADLFEKKYFVATSLTSPTPFQVVVTEAANEALSAKLKWPEFNSAHEGFAILAEEVDELWDHVKMNQKNKKKMKSLPKHMKKK